MEDDVRFASLSDGREIAYRFVSDTDGPVIVHPSGGPWPLDLLGDEAMYDRFLQTLGASGRVVIYDRPGVGSSDPFDFGRSWLDEMADTVVATLDAAGVDRAWIVGSTLVEIAQALRSFPDRFLGAVLVNPLSADRFRLVSDGAVNREREQRTEPVPSRANDPAFAVWLQRANRMASSGADRAAWMAAQRAAVEGFADRPEPVADCPSALMIRRRDAMGDAEVALWSEVFPGVEWVTIEGADSGVMGTDAGLVGELAGEFISGRPVEARADRELVAVLFTDLVDSTPTAASHGDAAWRAMLDRYEASLYRTVQRHHGSVVKYTGDGALATFRSGSEAVAAAIALANATRDLGLEDSTGIHVGEVERRDGDIGGIAVHLAARVMGAASPGQILVTSTVVESSVGGVHRFTDEGERSLKGIESAWRLYAVR